MSKVLITEERGPYQCRANDLATQRDAFKSDAKALRIELDQVKADLAAAREDVARMKAALVGVTPSYRVKGKCWCPHWLDLRSGHSDECKAARAAIDAARAGEGR